VLATLRPAVVVVIADALWQLARRACAAPVPALAAAVALIAVFAGVGEVAIVFIAAAVGASTARLRTAELRAVPLLELAAVCLKIGATLFGSGYVLIAYLRAEIVARGWISDRALLDAVAIGQVTPGPVSTAATFVGYLVAGVPGAVVATVGIFLPAFVLVGATGPFVERWRAHPTLAAALDLVAAVVVGLIAAVVVRLAPEAIVDRTTFAVALAAAAARVGLGLGPSTVLLAALGVGVLRALA